MQGQPTKLTPTMEKALVRYPASDGTPDQAWGVREGTRNALIARGLVEAIEGRTKYTNQPIYRYRRTVEGDRVANAIWKVARPDKPKGQITYDEHYGHVCTCTAFVDDVAYAPHTTYQNTVTADRNSGTESGSYWYSCSRCGAGAWSGL